MSVVFEPGDILAGRYEIVRTLGQGGMGMVYEANHLRLGTRVAVKTISRESVTAEDITRFEREARIGAALNTKYIARVHDIDTTDAGTVYIVMELLNGEDLEHHLKREVEMSRLVQWIMDVCEALVLAHESGIVHRDLKPANVFIVAGRDEHAKVVDFGIAKQVDQETLTKNAILGTPRYMSPEQIRGQKVDGRADIYSLGVILYRALSGRLPFTEENPIDYLAAAISSAPVAIEDVAAHVPNELAGIVMQAIEREPGRRFANARELQKALRDVLPRLPGFDGRTARTGTTAASTLAFDATVPTLDPQRRDPHANDTRSPRLFLALSVLVGAFVVLAVIVQLVQKPEAMSDAPDAAASVPIAITTIQPPVATPPTARIVEVVSPPEAPLISSPAPLPTTTSSTVRVKPTLVPTASAAAPTPIPTLPTATPTHDPLPKLL